MCAAQHYDLQDLSCVAEENPASPHFAPKKMYNVLDVARKVCCELEAGFTLLIQYF